MMAKIVGLYFLIFFGLKDHCFLLLSVTENQKPVCNRYSHSLVCQLPYCAVSAVKPQSINLMVAKNW